MGIHTPKWGSLSPARRQAFERAMTISPTSAGGFLIQDYVNRVIQNLTLREYGFMAVMDRRPGSGSQAIVNRRAPNATLAVWTADAVDPTEDSGTYSQATFTYETLATRGTVSRKLMAVGASYADILAEEMMHKAEDFAYMLEETACVGIAGAPANSPAGFVSLINAVGTDQVVDLSSAGPYANNALTLAALDQAIDRVKGASARADLAIVCSPAISRVLNALLQANQRFNDVTEIAAGFRVRTYDGIPIMVSTGMSDVCANVAAGVLPAAASFSGGTGSVLAVVNRRYMWVEELTPTTVLPLAKDTSANDSFDIYWDGAYVLGNSMGGSLIVGLSQAAS